MLSRKYIFLTITFLCAGSNLVLGSQQQNANQLQEPSQLRIMGRYARRYWQPVVGGASFGMLAGLGISRWRNFTYENSAAVATVMGLGGAVLFGIGQTDQGVERDLASHRGAGKGHDKGYDAGHKEGYDVGYNRAIWHLCDYIGSQLRHNRLSTATVVASIIHGDEQEEEAREAWDNLLDPLATLDDKNTVGEVRTIRQRLDAFIKAKENQPARGR
jgi:hypothetical protein